MNKRKSKSQYPEPFLNHVDQNQICDRIMGMISEKVKGEIIPKNPTPSQGYSINDWITTEQQIMTIIQNQQLDDATKVGQAKQKFGLMYAMIPYLLLSPMNLTIMASSFEEFCTELDEEATTFFKDSLHEPMSEIWQKLKYTNSKTELSIKRKSEHFDAINEEITKMKKDLNLNHGEMIKLLRKIANSSITAEDLAEVGVEAEDVSAILEHPVEAIHIEEATHGTTHDDTHDADSDAYHSAVSYAPSSHGTPEPEPEAHHHSPPPPPPPPKPSPPPKASPPPPKASPPSPKPSPVSWWNAISVALKKKNDNDALKLVKQEAEIRELAKAEEERLKQQQSHHHAPPPAHSAPNPKPAHSAPNPKQEETSLSILMKDLEEKEAEKQHEIQVSKKDADKLKSMSTDEIRNEISKIMSDDDTDYKTDKKFLVLMQELKKRDSEAVNNPESMIHQDPALDQPAPPSTVAQSVIASEADIKKILENNFNLADDKKPILVSAPTGADKMTVIQGAFKRSNPKKDNPTDFISFYGKDLPADPANGLKKQSQSVLNNIEKMVSGTTKKDRDEAERLARKALEFTLSKYNYIPVPHHDHMTEAVSNAYQQLLGVDVHPMLRGHGKHVRRTKLYY